MDCYFRICEYYCAFWELMGSGPRLLLSFEVSAS